VHFHRRSVYALLDIQNNVLGDATKDAHTLGERERGVRQAVW
jgi:hypothetical protein